MWPQPPQQPQCNGLGCGGMWGPTMNFSPRAAKTAPHACTNLAKPQYHFVLISQKHIATISQHLIAISQQHLAPISQHHLASISSIVMCRSRKVAAPFRTDLATPFRTDLAAPSRTRIDLAAKNVACNDNTCKWCFLAPTNMALQTTLVC